MEGHLIACIQDSLGLYLHDNARFLCERLVAEFPSEANTHLLATCYYRSDQAYRGYHLLLGASSPQSRYLLALCCMQMGKMTEAEHALYPDQDSSAVPNGAAGFFLLGRISRLSNRHKQAIACFSTALQLDPLLWSAYEELCTLGAEEEAAQLISADHLVARNNASAAHNNVSTPFVPPFTRGQQQPQTAGSQQATPMMFHPTPNPGGGTTSIPAARALGYDHSMITPPPIGAFVTPSPGGPAQASTLAGPPPLPNRLHAAPAGRGFERSAAGAAGTSRPAHDQYVGSPASTATPGANQRWKFMDEGKLRKVSGRLFSEPSSQLMRSSRVAPAPTDTTQRKGGDRGLGMGAIPEVQAYPIEADSPEHAYKTAGGHAAVLSLLQTLGEGFRLLCMYRCREAIEAFSRLSPHQHATGWVFCQIGRACFEMVDYPAAVRAFEAARQVDPYRLEGMEVYSTVLWHLKRDIELSHLAQEANALDRRSPYAWAVMGNCFSLQKEHENALKFFQRALQLDPAFTYAYTLCGHEYFANEDFDKGLACYRNALRIDPRHYNAWYGVGQIYFRQEKYDMAEYHFRRSLEVNERSSVLRCYLGMALHKVGRNHEALEMLTKAIEADPKNPLAKFEKASVLISDEKYHQALQELEALKEIAPGEASVWFQMGKIYKKLEAVDEAMAHFSTALDLKPPSTDLNLIKAAIEKIRIADDSEEEEI
ncbi:hypothetical protein WJX72_002594 [[Myrmecia] bisecta]|uniref:Uncharacterized protein n=1 Tax=[Myrmecia] bisecta TaxID=41462 RepID=A0AAW1QQL0_9CHLO